MVRDPVLPDGDNDRPSLRHPFDPDAKYGGEIHGDVRVSLPWNSDAFGKLIADGTTNRLDLPSHYDFNPERYRTEVNGTKSRTLDTNKYTDEDAGIRLTPAAGDTLKLFTAERPRYTVGYEAVASLAAKGETTLDTGDTIRLGLANLESPTSEAYFEITSTGQRAVLESNGSEVATESWTYPDGIDYQSPVRYEIQYNWYNVGRYLFTIAFTDDSRPMDGRQRKVVVAELTVDDDLATVNANYHLFHELDATTSGQELIAGSYHYGVLGDVSASVRSKASRLTELSYGGSGDYEALAAVRVDPDRRDVNCDFVEVEILPDGGSGELLVVVVDSSETDATDWGTPVQHAPGNSVIEETTTVSKFPDQDGTVVSSASDPNGYQVGFVKFDSAGTGSRIRTSSGGIRRKRPLHEDDVAIFLYKADSATARSVDVTYETEQDW